MDHLDQYYNALGLEPGASMEEVKKARRDLVKVWHPDRFSNDPRLQQKAQEKLKEINEAYERLQSSYRGHRPRVSRQGSKADPPPELGKNRYGESQASPESPAQADRSPETPVSPDMRWAAVIMVLLLVRVIYSPISAPSKATAPKTKETSSVTLSQSPATSLPTKDASSQTRGKIPIKERSPSAEESEKKYQEPREQGKPHTQWQPVLPSGYFGIGSTRDDVLAIQGEPSIIVGNTWHYKDSSVDFHGNQVSSYSDFSKKLKVRVLPSGDTSEARSRGYFTIGSTKDEVLAIQGTPASVIGNMWLYRDSSVDFYGHQVSGYSNVSKNLKVRVLPSGDTSEARSRGYFTIGSTKDEVLAIQGTPWSVIGNTWHYGDSSVYFYGNQVSSYSNVSKNLKIRLKSHLVSEGERKGPEEAQTGHTARSSR
jgi:curved DNA-binding protein CbpA